MQNAINQFKQKPELGQLDLAYNTNSLSVQVDVTQATPLVPGQAVKIVDSAGGLPKVIGCAADSDNVFGFVNYSTKDKQFIAGDVMEISMGPNVMYLKARGAIARGARVCLDVGVVGEVQALTSGASIVGMSLDKAANGEILRVMLLTTPSFAVYTP